MAGGDVDRREAIYAEWRARWIAGKRWFSTGRRPSIEMSVPPRLKLLDPVVRQLLSEASQQARRQAALAVSQLACDRVSITDSRLGAALARLQAGEHGDSPQRSAVLALTEELDEAAWDISRRADAGDADRADYVTAFRKARAANAVWYALDPDPLAAVVEATYEAVAAIEDQAAVRNAIHDSLN